MKLSRTTVYAIQASLQLAEQSSRDPVPCSQLAAAGHMPERFLLQILRALVTHDLLRSTRGVDGGYALNRDPSDITLLEVIEAVDGPIVSDQPQHSGLPSDTRARLQRTLDDITDKARRELASIKLSHLVSKNPSQS